MRLKNQLLICTGLATFMASPAFAQAAFGPQPAATSIDARASTNDIETAQIEDIVVTARKRAERLQDVPAAINAFDRAEIERHQLASVDDLTRLTPGLQTSDSAVSSGGSISLRGIGSGSSNYLGDQAVSINVDGMQVGSLNIRKTAQIDLGQIEVLRGPQALFFGKNSPGGVLSLKTNDPTSEKEVETRVGYEGVSGDSYVQMLMSGPISGNLEGRLVGRYTKLGGYFNLKSVAGSGDPLVIPPSFDSYPQGNEYFARGTLIYRPFDGLKVNAKVTYYKSDEKGGTATLGQRVACPFGTPQGQPNFPCTADRDVYTGGGPVIASQLVPGSPTSDGLGLRRNEQILSTIQADYDLTPNLRVTSLTGYYYFNELNAHNATIGPKATLLVPYLPFKMKQFSEEVRLVSTYQGPLNFTVGAYYEHRVTHGAQNAVILIAGPPFALGTERTAQGNDAYSMFGQLIWKPVSDFEISGGLRYSEERKDLKFSFKNVDVTGSLARNKLSFSNLSPEVTASYHVSRNLMLFGSYKQGFKSGGFDAGFTGGAIGRAAPGSFRNTFNNERVEGFESGLKGTLGRTVSFALTAYNYKYEDLQVGAYDPTTISFKVLNAAAARVKGVEFEGKWRTPLEGLSMQVTLAYNDAKFLDFRSGCYVGQTPALGCNLTANAAGVFQEQNLSGRRLNNAPPFTGYGGFLYTHPFDSGIGMDVTLDAEYSDAYATNLLQSPADKQNAFIKLNAGIRFFDASKKWEFGLLARNLTNEYTFSSSGAITFTGSGSGTPGSRLADTSAPVNRGREIVISLAYRL